LLCEGFTGLWRLSPPTQYLSGKYWFSNQVFKIKARQNKRMAGVFCYFWNDMGGFGLIFAIFYLDIKNNKICRFL